MLDPCAYGVSMQSGVSNVAQQRTCAAEVQCTEESQTRCAKTGVRNMVQQESAEDKTFQNVQARQYVQFSKEVGSGGGGLARCLRGLEGGSSTVSPVGGHF